MKREERKEKTDVIMMIRLIRLLELSSFSQTIHTCSQNTPLLNGQNDKSRDQRSGILHIVRDP